MKERRRTWTARRQPERNGGLSDAETRERKGGLSDEECEEEAERGRTGQTIELDGIGLKTGQQRPLVRARLQHEKYKSSSENI
jgi:hypothetical protein